MRKAFLSCVMLLCTIALQSSSCEDRGIPSCMMRRANTYYGKGVERIEIDECGDQKYIDFYSVKFYGFKPYEQITLEAVDGALEPKINLRMDKCGKLFYVMYPRHHIRRDDISIDFVFKRANMTITVEVNMYLPKEERVIEAQPKMAPMASSK